MQDFRRLKVWEKGHSLTLEIHRVTEDWPPTERFSLTDQLRRAAISVAANIVEGTARGTDRETVRFLRISLASAAELQYHLLLARDLRLLTEPVYQHLTPQAIELKRMLSGFVTNLTSQRARSRNDRWLMAHG
jgi:four helix bundle protein